MKNDARKLALFALAALFRAADIAGQQKDGSPGLAFDRADAFLDEAAKRGMNVEELAE